MSSTKALLGFLFALSLTACAVRPKGEFDASRIPPVPDYSNLDNWAAHPDKTDPSDRTPMDDIKNGEGDAAVDVLFFYPTTYTGAKRYENQWNADVNDARINKKT